MLTRVSRVAGTSRSPTLSRWMNTLLGTWKANTSLFKVWQPLNHDDSVFMITLATSSRRAMSGLQFRHICIRTIRRSSGRLGFAERMQRLWRRAWHHLKVLEEGFLRLLRTCIGVYAPVERKPDRDLHVPETRRQREGNNSGAVEGTMMPLLRLPVNV